MTKLDVSIGQRLYSMIHGYVTVRDVSDDRIVITCVNGDVNYYLINGEYLLDSKDPMPVLFYDKPQVIAPSKPRPMYKNVNGFKVPNNHCRVIPDDDELFCYPDPFTFLGVNDQRIRDLADEKRAKLIEHKAMYYHNDEGLKAASIHAAALLGQGERYEDC